MWLEFELAYFEASVKYFHNYTSGIPHLIMEQGYCPINGILNFTSSEKLRIVLNFK